MNLTAAPAWTLKGNKLTIDKLNPGYQNCSPGPIYFTTQKFKSSQNNPYQIKQTFKKSFQQPIGSNTIQKIKKQKIIFNKDVHCLLQQNPQSEEFQNYTQEKLKTAPNLQENQNWPYCTKNKKYSATAIPTNNTLQKQNYKRKDIIDGKQYNLGCHSLSTKKRITKNHNNFFGLSKRQVFQIQSRPGPSDYFPTHPNKHTNHVHLPTSRSQRNQEYNLKVNINPAPGAYRSNPVKKQQNTFSKSHSATYLNPILFINCNPGVGDYEIKEQNRFSGCKIGKSNRTNFVNQSKPGVGDYEIERKQKVGVCMSKSKRFKSERESPGPASYKNPGTLANYNCYYQKK